MLSVDIETIEVEFKKLGSGCMRDIGYILCIGIFDGRTYACYEPDDPELIERLASDEPKVFHNSIYDLGWLVCAKEYKVGGVLHDTMTRAALIDEYSELNLDACCKRMRVEGKNAGDTIEKWFEKYGKERKLKGSLWDNADVIWRDPEGRDMMIRYNKQDCIATYRLFEAQEAQMGMHREAYEIECRLQPVWLEMKKNGIRIDEVARDRLAFQVEKDLDELEQHLIHGYGLSRKILASPKKMTVAMNALGIQSPVLTASGAQSWAAGALSLIDHDCIDVITDVKIREAVISKCLKKAFVDFVHNGRIHCNFSPNKRDGGGTVTGRLSSSGPNLQQVPSKEYKGDGRKAYGKELRTLFLPEEGCLLAALDYSMIEAVLLAHYAQGDQAEWFRDQMRAGIDFHTTAMGITGIKDRSAVKSLNYGVIYGMGAPRMYLMNRSTFKTLENTQMIFAQYHAGLPVIKATMQWCQNLSAAQGYTVDIGGRVHHRPPAEERNGKWQIPYYKTLNYQIQGAASGILKKGLLDSWDAGLFNTLKLHLTVHDENVVSMPYNKEGAEALAELQRCMLGAYSDRLTVPLSSSCEVGPNWGYWNDDIWQRLKAGDFETDRRLVA